MYVCFDACVLEGASGWWLTFMRTQTTQQLAGRVAAAAVASGTTATSTEQEGLLVRLRQRLVESAPVYAAVNLEALIRASSSSSAASSSH